MAKLLIRFWILDDDTGEKKIGSPWFNYDTDKIKIVEWLDEYSYGRCFIEQTKYVKESIEK